MSERNVTIINQHAIPFEAGEIYVSKDDQVGPAKLKLLGTAGWSLNSAWKNPDGGFQMLLTRPLDSTRAIMPKPLQSLRTPPVHANGPRCPQYCSCFSMEGMI